MTGKQPFEAVVTEYGATVLRVFPGAPVLYRWPPGLG